MFRPHDLRGIYGETITEERFYSLGAATRRIGRAIVIGTDYRLNNETLVNAFCSGFQGEVKYLGKVPTPLTAFHSKELGASFTASHNPPNYNGLKFFKNRTYFSEAEMSAVKAEFEKRPKETCLIENKMPPENGSERIKEYIVSLPSIEKGIFDLCGGAACAIKEVFPKTLFDEPDPSYEHHKPEPKNETLQILKEKTIEEGEVGFAFDGDADRLIIVDEGRLVEGDVIAAYVAENHLRKGARMVLSIDCRQEVFDFIEGLGIKAYVSRVGDPNMLGEAIAEGADLSAERSGHFAFLKHAPNSDGIYAAAVLSNARAGDFMVFSSRFKNTTLIEQEYIALDFNKLKSLVEERNPESVYTLDGVKAVFDDYTLLIRASNTETKVRINCEARTKEKAREGLELGKMLVARSRA